jgi:hypothetical protein
VTATNGLDITGWISAAVFTADITWRLILGVIGAEADWNLTAERWGSRTQEALVALEANDRAKLRHIIASEWPDISFGPSQHTVESHYWGDNSRDLDNVLAVRAYVFANPDKDILAMAKNLAWRKAVILESGRDLSRVNGDVDLATAVSYNRGSYPGNRHSYWVYYAENVARYQASFAETDRKLAEMSAEALSAP